MDRTNGGSGSDQHEEGDIPDTGQPDRGNGHGEGGSDDRMGGGESGE